MWQEEHTHLEDCCQSEASWAQEQSSQLHDLESEKKNKNVSSNALENKLRTIILNKRQEELS